MVLRISLFITLRLKMYLNQILLSYIVRVCSDLAQSHSALCWKMSYVKTLNERFKGPFGLIYNLYLVPENESTPRQQLLEHFLRLLQRSDHTMHDALVFFSLFYHILSLKSAHRFTQRH